jgi:hypothetical protein
MVFDIVINTNIGCKRLTLAKVAKNNAEREHAETWQTNVISVIFSKCPSMLV